MSEQTPDLAEPRQKGLAAIECLQHTREMPIAVALDGISGVGKSTLASLIAEDVHAAVIQVDDFFAANIPDAEWDGKSVEQRATECFDRQPLRSEALEPLISGRAASRHDSIHAGHSSMTSNASRLSGRLCRSAPAAR